MTLAQWIDPADDDVVTLDGTEITAIADKSPEGNDIVAFPSADLLASFDGADAATAFTSEDESARVGTFIGNAQLDTAQFKYGSASLLLDGAGDHVTFPDSRDWRLGAGQFTIEFWVRFNGDPGTGSAQLLNYYDHAADERSWGVLLINNVLRWNWSTDGAVSGYAEINTAWNPAGDTWYHIAVTRDEDNDFRLFVDGAVIKTQAHAVTYHDAVSVLSVGATATGNNPTNGWFDDVRITKGVALYTAAFTVPQDAYPVAPIASTVDSKRAMDFSLGSKLKAANAGLTNMGGPDFTVFVALGDDNNNGKPTAALGMSDAFANSGGSGWRVDKAFEASPIDVSAGDRADGLQAVDAVYNGVVALSVDATLGYMTGYANGVNLGTAPYAVPFTAFLANLDGADAATSYTSEDAGLRVATFTGNAQLDTAQKQFGTASLLLDGTGDYVSFPDSPNFDFADGDFTVECWVRFNTVSGQQVLVGKWDWTGAPANGSWMIRHDNGAGTLKWTHSTTGGNAITTGAFSWAPSTATWYHVAVCRAGDVLYMFVDGVLLGSVAYTPTIFSSAATLRLGAYQDDLDPTEPFDGWLDDVRIVKGHGLYQEDFDVPAAANTDESWGLHYDLNVGWLPRLASWDAGDILEVVYVNALMRTDERNRVEGYLNHKWNTTIDLPAAHPFIGQAPDIVIDPTLLINLDGTDGDTAYTSEDSGARTVTFVGNAELDGAQSKYGPTSLILDGTGDYITVPDSTDWEFGSGPFTVECWVRFNGDPGAVIMNFVGHYDHVANERSWIVSVNNNQLSFDYTTDGTAGTHAAKVASWNPVTATWYHVAITKDENSDLRFFIDGVLLSTQAHSVTLHSATSVLSVGATATGDNELNGWVDNVRVVKGEALYERDFFVPHRGFVLPVPAAFLGNFNGDDAATAYTSEDSVGHVATFGGNAEIDTAQKKFGHSSLKLDGSGDYVSFPDHADFDLPNDDWTIEFWLRFNGDPGAGSHQLITKWTGVAQGSYSFSITTNLLRFGYSSTGADTILGYDQSWNPAGDTWYHVAYERFNGDVYHFVDGVQLGAEVALSAAPFLSSAPLRLGTIDIGGSNLQFLNGWLDGVRITTGRAVYQGTAFDVPVDAPGEPII